MSTPEDKKNKGGAIVRFEPQNISAINADPTIRVAFQQVGCMRFCETIQGYHLQLTKEFAKGFDGVKEKLGSLTFPISSQTISEPTEIPLGGEEWFKGMEFNLDNFEDFLKPKHWKRYGYVVPRSHLQDHHSKLLEVIQRYYTCEGRFNKSYHYHIKLLMNFTSKKPLNLPYYLFRILCKMANIFQAKGDHIEANLFHFSLKKFLVIKELEKKD